MLSKREFFITKFFKKKWKKDSIYLSIWFNKFLNKIMVGGKKVVIEKCFVIVLFLIKKSYNRLPIFIFFEALAIVSPSIELISKRLGRDQLQIPIPIVEKRQVIKGVSWFRKSIQIFSSSSLVLAVYTEFIKVHNYHKGVALDKKIQTYKQGVFGRTHENFR